MSEKLLFSPMTIRGVTLKNRIVVPPMHQYSAEKGFPTDWHLMNAGKFAAGGAGLVIVESTKVERRGCGTIGDLGIWDDKFIAPLSRLAGFIKQQNAVAGIQLGHSGRKARASRPWEGDRPLERSAEIEDWDAWTPVAPSAIRAKTKTFVNGTFADVSEPRALELSEIPGIIDDFKRATANAIAAGFDGVEIHGANGYLLDQFAKDGTNKRTDAYGGSIENRAKLMLEVSKAVVGEAGGDRTGIRISPVTPANDVSDSNPQPLFDYIVDHLNALKLTYIHVIEGATGGPRDNAPFDYASLRKRFKQAYIANNGYDFALAEKVLEAGAADLIAFGKPFISNPDLVERLKAGAPLNEWDKATFYGGGAKGYTDYPTLKATEAAE